MAELNVTNSTFLNALWNAVPDTVSINFPLGFTFNAAILTTTLLVSAYFINKCLKSETTEDIRYSLHKRFSNEPKFMVFVKRPNGLTKTLHVSNSDRIMEIFRLYGESDQRQRFVYAAKTLDRRRTFGSYNIPKESTIHENIGVGQRLEIDGGFLTRTS